MYARYNWLKNVTMRLTRFILLRICSYGKSINNAYYIYDPSHMRSVSATSALGEIL